MDVSVKSFLIIASLLAFGGTVIWGLGDALVPLMISFGMAYLVFPLIKKLERKGVGRNYAVLAVFSLFIITLVISLILVIPRLLSEANELAQEFPQTASRAIGEIEAVSAKLGYDLDLSTEGIRAYVDEHASEISGSLVKSFADSLKGAFSGIANWLLSILNLFLIPLFFFYVINDFEKISSSVTSFIPPSLQPRLSRHLKLSNQVLSGYIRGQLMVALLLGGLYAIGLTVIGLKFGFVVGLVSGLISIIPYAGFTLGFLAAILIGLANYSGIELFLGIAAVYTVVQILESTVITPKLVGDKVGLSSLATILALIVGGNLLGITGMLLAIPVAAIARTILIDLKKEYVQLDIFKS